jgi:hypothetical protein
MKMTRRELLGLLSWAMAAPAFLGWPRRVMAELAASAEIEQQESAAVAYFEKLGYKRLPAMNLITGDSFNGGLRFDDTPPAYPPGRTLRVQNCVRIDDLAKKGQPGVLLYFHIFSLSIEKPASSRQLLSQLLEYLIGKARLDPARFALVSTDHFKPYLAQLKSFGIQAGQFVERDRKEAMTIGDGSGYFNPPGHPYSPRQHTVSIHYARIADAKGKALKYPLPGHDEIAEVVIDPGAGNSLHRQIGGFGIERLMLAQGMEIDSFDASRQKALAAIKAEARRRGVALPKGYQIIAND